MERVKPWVIGAAVALTMGVVYVACATASLLVPDGFLSFANNWVHALDLSLIKRPASASLSLNDLGIGFATAVAAGFLAGATYGWARNLFARLAALDVGGEVRRDHRTA